MLNKLKSLRKTAISTAIISLIVSCGAHENNHSNFSNTSTIDSQYIEHTSKDLVIGNLISTFEPDSYRNRKKVPGTISYVSVDTDRNCVDLTIAKHVTGDGERSKDYQDIVFWCIDRHNDGFSAFDKEWPAYSFKLIEAGTRQIYEISSHEAIHISRGGLFCNLRPGDECPRELSHVRKSKSVIEVDSSNNLVRFEVQSENYFKNRSGRLVSKPSDTIRCDKNVVEYGKCL